MANIRKRYITSEDSNGFHYEVHEREIEGVEHFRVVELLNGESNEISDYTTVFDEAVSLFHEWHGGLNFTPLN